jgi:hypothetical protein
MNQTRKITHQMMKLVIINNGRGEDFVDRKLLNIIIIVHYGDSRWNPKMRRIFLNENC